ncbi:MAG: hypothetical protein HYY06_16830 [Deltaproteobacteria bacterium]|nr:hypothetical protein [Deltaproteobacteria bacterium]
MRILALVLVSALVGCAGENHVAPAGARAAVVTVDGTARLRVTFEMSRDDGAGLKVVREYQVLRAHDVGGPFEPFAHSKVEIVSKQVRARGKTRSVATRLRSVDDTSALPGRTYVYQVWALAEREVGSASQAGAFSGSVVTRPVALPGAAGPSPEGPRGVANAAAAAPEGDDGRHVDVSFEISPDDGGGSRPVDGYVVLRATKKSGPYIPFVEDGAPAGALEEPVDPSASEDRVRYLVGLLGSNARIDPADLPAKRALVRSGQLRDPGDEEGRPEPLAASLAGVILDEVAGSRPPDPAASRRRTVTDTVARDGPFHYRIYTVPARGDAVRVQVRRPARPAASWVSIDKLNMAILLGAAFLLTLVLVQRASRSGHQMFIRRIAGIDALEEAVGRATEMGRPILYVPGIDEIQNIQTIASLLILGRVSELVARYDSQIRVPCCIPIVATVAEEVVRQGFYNAGRPDQHRPQNIQWISSEQFAFCAGTNGIMLRDRPATNVFLGRFFAESLILAETGYVNKAIQIGGTAEITQLPFFIAACDYAIIGEELFAISAYMTREPKLLGSLKAADWIKAGVLLIVTAAALGGLLAWTAAPLSGPTALVVEWALRLVGFLAPGT